MTSRYPVVARGATIVAPDEVHFNVWVPRARHVDVVLTTGRAAGRHPLRAGDGGEYTVVVPGVAAGDDYAFSLDGGPPLPDPVSRWQPYGVRGPSRVVDPRRFVWQDASWHGLAMADYVIYETHIGTFTSDGTFDAAIAHLRALAELGITAIELMPVAQFPGTRNWGYDGVHLYAPQHSYGGPEALRRLVDAAHAAGLALVLDVVYNHIGPEGSTLPDFGPYLSERHHTPWGATLDFDGPHRDEARRYVIDNARYWVDEFHVDALRLDAVHAIMDDGPHHIVGELGARVHELGMSVGRRVHVIAEHDVIDPWLVRDAHTGGLALDAQWADDFHHGAHVALTRERTGLYAGWDGLGDVAAALERRSTHPSPRDAVSVPAPDVSPDHFVFYVQNHDQVGNRADGARLASLLSPEQQRVAAALVLLAPCVPLLFMGDEYGERRPFLFFVSHEDPALVHAVREGRRRELAARGFRDAPDPGAIETFTRSRLDRRAALADPSALHLLALHRDLLALRRTEPALRPGDATVSAHAVTRDVLVVELVPRAPHDPSRALCAVFNVGVQPHTVSPGTPPAGLRWRDRWSSRDARYGGPGHHHAAVHTDRVRVPPITALLLSLEDR